MKVMPAGAGAAETLAALHARAFERAWSALEIRRLIDNPAAFAVLAEDKAAPLGFILAWAPGGEAEILTVAVDPAARRRGVGTALANAAMAGALIRGADAMLLEVAADNAGARMLYEKLGFAEVGRRAGYYARIEGPVDALLLRRSLPRPKI